MNKKTGIVLLASVVTLSAFAQNKIPQPVGSPSTAPATVQPSMSMPLSMRPGPKPFGEVITPKAKTTVGLVIVHRIEDKIYFELPDSLLNRDVLIVSRLAKAAVDMRSGTSMNGYAGDALNQSVIRFEKGPNNKIFVRELSYSERSKDSSEPMFQAVMHSNIQPISMAFDVKAYHGDSTTGRYGTVIDVTDLVNSDNDMFFFGASKSKFGIGGYQPDKSYLLDIKTFPLNTEIKTIKTYSRSQMGGGPMQPGAIAPQTQGSSKPATVELNTSIVLLPKVPMQPRFADDRVGYFSSSYTDFDANPQGVKHISFIERWKLEPKDGEMEKYKRGELVEPKKPIVIYIDPETPAKWVPYLIQGINDWQMAFEKAGFKNAIIGKVAPTPEEDPTWSLDDARNSAVVYKPSSVANASGPHITDPRSGEVIETHINWYHNVMKLIHDWYFVQAAAVDPKARKMNFDDKLMGELIRFVSSHEVGHTLGLLHNFGSSSATPVEKLRDKKWVEANGHTASIMDYARFNYVAQPEDSISELGLFPRIGDYDKWAIEWGYKLIPEATTPEKEIPVLEKWVVAKSKDKKYWFGNEMSQDDPRAQSEDIGDNAMKAGAYGIKNLKRVMANLIDWTHEENEGYENLEQMHSQVFKQYVRYVNHVVKNFGGRYETIKSVEQTGPVYELVPTAIQKEAMAFINDQVFTTPIWLIDKKILALTGTQPSEIINGLQENVLSAMLSATIFTRLLNGGFANNNVYQLSDYLTDIQKAVFSELDAKKPIDVYRRNLQNVYVDKMVAMISGTPQNPKPKSSDITATVRAMLNSLKTRMHSSLPFAKDSITKYHLADLIAKIDMVFND